MTHTSPMVRCRYDADALVVGGGHNALTCAAYLARGGMDVLVLERRSTVGGCASSDALFGSSVSLCNCDHTMVRASGIVETLDLCRFGLRYVDLDPVRHHLIAGHAGTDGAWTLFHDVDRTLDNLATTHKTQVAGYRRYLDDALPAAALLLATANRFPGPGPLAGELARHGGRGATLLLQLSRDTLAGALARWFDDEDLVAPAAVTGPAVWGLGPYTPGTGLAALGYALSHVVRSGRPVGGSGALTDALAGAVLAGAGRIRTGAEVVSIDCAGDQVVGVTIAGGEQLRAPVVISGADPRRTLVDWVRDPPPGALRLARRWARRPPPDGYESKVDAVVTRRPVFRSDGEAGATGSTVVMAPGLDGIVAAHQAAQRAEVARSPVMMANLPDLCDPSLAPTGGGHLLSLEVLFTPYALRQGWATTKEPQRWLDALAAHTTTPDGIAVEQWRAMTPEDYERRLGLARGYAPSFGGGPLAAVVGRPRALVRYQTPLRGLYLTGAGTFPGAGVWGASGRNAAAVVLAARRKRSAA